MSVKVATGELLLDSLIENAAIKAAVLVDSRGSVVERRGAASCLKIAAQDGTPSAPAGGKAKPNENLYIIEAGADFLIVIFDDRTNFERIKESVDSTLDKFGMAPATEE